MTEDSPAVTSDSQTKQSVRTVIPPTLKRATSSKSDVSTVDPRQSSSKIMKQHNQEKQLVSSSPFHFQKTEVPNMPLKGDKSEKRVSQMRVVLPRATYTADGGLPQRRVVPPRGKSEAIPSTVTTPAEPSSSSQTGQVNSRKALALQSYLEEMELKIRYMKNDIEFKQSQMSSQEVKPKRLVPSRKSSISVSKLSAKSLPFGPSSTNSTTSSYSWTKAGSVPTSVEELKHVISNVHKLNSQKTSMYKFSKASNGPLVSSKLNDVQFLSAVTTPASHMGTLVPSFSRHQSHIGINAEVGGDSKSICPSSEHKPMHAAKSTGLTSLASVQKVQQQTSSSAVGSSEKPYSSLELAAMRMYSKVTATSLASAGHVTSGNLNSGRMVLAGSGQAEGTFNLLRDQTVSAVPKPVYVSPDKRTVIFNKPESSGVPQSFITTWTNKQPIFSQTSATTDSDKRQLERNNGIAHNTLNIVSDPASAEVARKDILTGIGTSAPSSTAPNSVYKFIRSNQGSTGKLTPSHSSYSLHDSSILSLKAATPVRPKSFVSRFSLRRTPKLTKLNIQAAAKLVISKYKLKRLSPISASKTAPQLVPSRRETQKLHLRQGVKYLMRDAVGSSSLNPHKLDRRLQGSFVSDNAIKTFGSNVYRSTLGKHKLDGQAGPSHLVTGMKRKAVPLSGNILKLDKRVATQMRDSIAVSNQDQKFGKHASAVALRRRSKHHWVRDEHARSSGNDRNQQSQGSSKINKSRFNWSRPTEETQNAEWQQLRLKLRYLLSKKRSHIISRMRHMSVAGPARYHYTLARYSGQDANHVMIGGVMYRRSNRKLTRAKSPVTTGHKNSTRVMGVKHGKKNTALMKNMTKSKMKLITVRGVHFHIDSAGKKLCRTKLGTSSTSASPSRIQDPDMRTLGHADKLGDEKARLAATRAVYRSIAIATAKYRKNNQRSKTKKQHCIFFGRFGKCHRGNKCPFVHDPEKVAVCTRFLRGKCDSISCPFSHEASVYKMPVCLFYLQGSCSRDICPYLHVKVNPSAPVCKDFRNGFCMLGEKCKKIHSHVCPSFAINGTCSRGERCTMLHRSSKRAQEGGAAKSKQGASSTTEKSPADHSNVSESEKHITSSSTEASFIMTFASSAPLAVQPSFISLAEGSKVEDAGKQKNVQQYRTAPALSIRPTFVFGKSTNLHGSSSNETKLHGAGDNDILQPAFTNQANEIIDLKSGSVAQDQQDNCDAESSKNALPYSDSAAAHKKTAALESRESVQSLKSSKGSSQDKNLMLQEKYQAKDIDKEVEVCSGTFIVKEKRDVAGAVCDQRRTDMMDPCSESSDLITAKQLHTSDKDKSSSQSLSTSPILSAVESVEETSAVEGLQVPEDQNSTPVAELKLLNNPVPINGTSESQPSKLLGDSILVTQPHSSTSTFNKDHSISSQFQDLSTSKQSTDSSISTQSTHPNTSMRSTNPSTSIQVADQSTHTQSKDGSTATHFKDPSTSTQLKDQSTSAQFISFGHSEEFIAFNSASEKCGVNLVETGPQKEDLSDAEREKKLSPSHVLSSSRIRPSFLALDRLRQRQTKAADWDF